MSSNRSAFPDETGAFPDWVELTNTGDSPINIKGYGLSTARTRSPSSFRI